jgi:Family of unknown function (DUF6459)
MTPFVTHRTAVIPLPSRRAWLPVDTLAARAEHTQGSLALSYSLPAGLSAHPRTTALVLLPHGTPKGCTAGMEVWAATFIQAVVEVIASDRPLAQMVRWTSRRVYADIAQRQRWVARHRGSSGVRSKRHQVATVRVCQPFAGCAEVAARVVFGRRSRAVAARLDMVNDRWVCTAITFG